MARVRSAWNFSVLGGFPFRCDFITRDYVSSNSSFNADTLAAVLHASFDAVEDEVIISQILQDRLI